MHPATNTFPFNLRVVEARGLFASKRDIADPFVVVKLKGLKHIFNSEKQTTDVKMNNESPVFNQDFTLHPKETDTIMVKLMDKNTPINRKLGRVLIPVQSYLNRGVIDSWFPLEGKTERAGEVHLLMNFGGKGFTGFRDYLSHKSTLPAKGATTVPAPITNASFGRGEGTTTVKETTWKSRDGSYTTDRPVLPPSQTVPLQTAPIAPTTGMQNLNLGNPSTTAQLREPIKNVVLSRDTVVQERIHPMEQEVIQPIIHRERQQTEIHRVTQNVNEAQTLPTVYQEKTLAPEYRENYHQNRDFLAEETNTRGALFSSREVDATKHTKVVNAPIVEETIKKTIIEVVQPVVHRETVTPVVIKETLPIYEKVIEEPIVYNDVRNATNLNRGTTNFATNNNFQQGNQPIMKETIVTSTTFQPNTFGAKVPPTNQTLNQHAHQSF